MEVVDVAQRYFEAWNRHDPDSIVATFAEGGTYSDPNVPEGLTFKRSRTPRQSYVRHGSMRNPGRLCRCCSTYVSSMVDSLRCTPSP
jgi:hypothetical protein